MHESHLEPVYPSEPLHLHPCPVVLQSEEELIVPTVLQEQSEIIIKQFGWQKICINSQAAWLQESIHGCTCSTLIKPDFASKIKAIVKNIANSFKSNNNTMLMLICWLHNSKV